MLPAMQIHYRALLFASLSVLSATASEVGEVTVPESSALERRVQTRNFTIMGFGPGALSGLGDDGFVYHLQGGWWREAHPNAAIRILSDFDFRPDFNAWKLDAGLGAVWLPSREPISPFVGADFGWGIADGRKWASGFTLGGSLGMQLFRTASTQMSVGGRGTILLDNGMEKFPWATSLALSVVF